MAACKAGQLANTLPPGSWAVFAVWADTGRHRNHQLTAETMRNALHAELTELDQAELLPSVHVLRRHRTGRCICD